MNETLQGKVLYPESSPQGANRKIDFGGRRYVAIQIFIEKTDDVASERRREFAYSLAAGRLVISKVRRQGPAQWSDDFCDDSHADEEWKG